MAKKRKTRRQKISNDLRHTPEVHKSEQAQPVASLSNTFVFTPSSSIRQSASTVTTTSNPVFKADLIRTLSVTVAIVLAQIVLYFLLQV